LAGGGEEAKNIAKRSDVSDLDPRPNGVHPGGLHYIQDDK